MAKSKRRYVPTPRILTTTYQIASYLDRSEGWFRTKQPKLEEAGFPQEDKLLGGWDIDAIDRWLDKRSGLTQDSGTRNTMDEILGDGDGRFTVL